MNNIHFSSVISESNHIQHESHYGGNRIKTPGVRELISQGKRNQLGGSNSNSNLGGGYGDTYKKN